MILHGIVGQRGRLKSVLRRWESDTGAAGSVAEQTRLQDVLLPTFLLVPAARSCPLGCLTASFQCREMEKTKAVGKSECFFCWLSLLQWLRGRAGELDPVQGRERDCGSEWLWWLRLPWNHSRGAQISVFVTNEVYRFHLWSQIFTGYWMKFWMHAFLLR